MGKALIPVRLIVLTVAEKVARNLNVPASQSVAAGRSALMAKLAKEISVGVDPVLQVLHVLQERIDVHSSAFRLLSDS